MFRKAGRPRFKSFRRGLNSIEGTNNQEIMYKPERGAIVWRKHVMTYMKPDTGYMKEALASDRRVKYCRIVRRTLNGVKRWFVQLVVEGLPPFARSMRPNARLSASTRVQAALLIFMSSMRRLSRLLLT